MTKDKLTRDRLPFGNHKRAILYQGFPDLRGLISQEASGERIERLPDIEDEAGKMLVLGEGLDYNQVGSS